MRRLIVGLFVFSAVAAFAPGGDSKKQNKGTVVEIDELKATTPADWIKEKPSNRLRSINFACRAKDDKEDAEVAISATVIGSQDDVLKRWKEVFQPPDGKTLEDVTRVDKAKAGKVALVYMDIYGTYLYKDRPMSTAKPVPKPGFRMLSVLFVSPDGPTRIWVIGPAATVEKHKKGFDEWVKSFK